MAEPEVVIAGGEEEGDEEMGEAEGVDDVDDAPEDPTGLEDIEPTIAERTTFLEYVLLNNHHHSTPTR